MPIYRYTAIDGTGRRLKGTIEAPTEDMALGKLQEERLMPVELVEDKKSSNVEDIIAKWRPVPAEALAYFTRQLATMIDSGMTSMRALSTLEEQESNPKFREIISSLIARAEAGTPLHVAFAEHPDTFPRLFVAMVRAGEESGDLPGALKELANQVEASNRLRKAIKSATVYPKVLLGVAFLVISGILIFIIPKFADMYTTTLASSTATGQTADTSLPLPTQILITLSHILYPPDASGFGLLLGLFWRVALFALLFFGARKFVKYLLSQPGPRAKWDRYKLNAPMRIGTLVRKITSARFSRTFASLLGSGVSAVESLEIVAETSGNVIVSGAILQAREQMLSGERMSDTLARSGAFPPTVTRMIEVGEETGQIEQMLLKIAEFYEEDVELTIKSLSSIIEPIMILFVGSIIGAIVIAVYLPLLSIYDKIGQ